MSDVERYAEELKALMKEEESSEIPDRVERYTHDVNGRRLPCAYVQLNQQYVHHLNKIPKHIQAKNDYFGLCFGYPGSGKTHLMIRTCLYLNADFGLKDISFTVNQLEEWISEAKPGSVGLFDEADAMAGGYYDEVLQALIRNSKRIRTKQLILFFCTPTMRDMHHFFAFRAKMVVYCFVPKKSDPGNRGWMHLWHDQDLISDLFARMKKAYSENSRVYNSAFCTLKNKYNGRDIPDDWPILDASYEARKEDGRRALEAEQGLTPKQAVMKERGKYAKRLHQLMHEINSEIEGGKPRLLTQQRLAGVFDLSPQQYSKILGEVS